jgi:hypothetical protein
MRELASIIGIFLLTSCSVKQLSAQKFRNAVFKQVGGNENELHFIDSAFVVLSPPGAARCCDTISKGTFTYDSSRQLLRLTSYSYINDSKIDMFVQEALQANGDSIRFEFSSPVQAWEDGSYGQNIKFYYQVIVNLKDKKNPNWTDWIAKKSEKPIFSIPISKEVDYVSFFVEIFPNYYRIPIRNFSYPVFASKTYSIAGSKSNIFKIDFPILTFDYLAYKRLNNDIIVIKDSDTLEWDGLFYKRSN